MLEQNNATPMLHWSENGADNAARWRSEAGMPPPKRVVIADDRLTADTAYRYACEGTAMLWRGDYQNARQLLQALMRRIERIPKKSAKPVKTPKPPISMTEAFHLHRQAQAQRARTLARLLLPLDADYRVPLRRAPDIRLACEDVYGANGEASVVSLREVLGLIGAHEWRKKGSRFRRWRRAFIRTTACFLRCAANTSIWLRRRRCQRRRAPSTSGPAPACSPRCLQSGVLHMWSSPIRTAARSLARERISNGSV